LAFFILSKEVSGSSYDLPMIWLYRLLFLCVLPFALPYYLYRMWRRGGYGKDFHHRFGRMNQLGPVPAGKTRIWLQAVSVGEVLAVGPLIRALGANPAMEIVLTTTTSTGYAEARKRYAADTLCIGIFPLDFWLFNRSAWRRIRPSAILLMESELWPEHLHQAKKYKVPAFLINARLSDRSYRRYQLISKPALRLLRKFERIYAASSQDAHRFRSLGCAAEQLRQTGSIKFDVPVGTPLDPEARAKLRHSLGFSSESAQPPFIVVGASTWPGEESALIEAQQYLQAHGVDCRLLLVPRHAERGGSIAQALEKQSMSWCQRSKSMVPSQDTQIYLADTTGELTTLMQAGDLAFIGKSLPPNDGGQTPIEAAGLGLPLLVGPNMTNFQEVTRSLIECGAAQLVQSGDQLKAALLALSEDRAARDKMSASSRDWHESNRGSSQRIVNDLEEKLLK
jgi:3-deoxy-D-manno-octulosonic-acid transferase